MKKPVLFLTLSNGIAATLGLLAGVIVARELGPAELGLFTVAMAWMIVSATLADFGLTTATVRYGAMYLASEPERAYIVFTEAFRMRLIIASVLLMFCIPIGYTVTHLFQPIIGVSLIILAIAGGSTRSLFNAVISYLRASQLFKLLAVIIPLPNILKLTCVWIALAMLGMRKANIALGIYIATPLLGSILSMLILRPPFWKQTGYTERRLLMKLAFLTIVMQLVGSVTAKLDVFMLSYYSTSLQVGYYGAALQIALGLEICSTAVEAVILPYVSTLRDHSAIVKYLKWIAPYTISIICIILAISAMPIWEPIVIFVYGHPYAPSVLPLRFLLIAQGLVLIAIPIYAVLYPLNKPQMLTHLSFVRLAISWLIYRLLIPSWGAIGAAVGTLIAQVIGFILTSGLILLILRTRQNKVFVKHNHRMEG